MTVDDRMTGGGGVGVGIGGYLLCCLLSAGAHCRLEGSNEQPSIILDGSHSDRVINLELQNNLVSVFSRVFPVVGRATFDKSKI